MAKARSLSTGRPDIGDARKLVLEGEALAALARLAAVTADSVRYWDERWTGVDPLSLTVGGVARWPLHDRLAYVAALARMAAAGGIRLADPGAPVPLFDPEQYEGTS